MYADDFLYDMRTDPFQLNNRAADPSMGAVKEELRGKLLDWIYRAEGARPRIIDGE